VIVSAPARPCPSGRRAAGGRQAGGKRVPPWLKLGIDYSQFSVYKSEIENDSQITLNKNEDCGRYCNILFIKLLFGFNPTFKTFVRKTRRSNSVWPYGVRLRRTQALRAVCFSTKGLEVLSFFS
jgi:hypothetical protein